MDGEVRKNNLPLRDNAMVSLLVRVKKKGAALLVSRRGVVKRDIDGTTTLSKTGKSFNHSAISCPFNARRMSLNIRAIKRRTNLIC